MHTQLHKKILAACWTTRDGQGHWILKGSRTIWVPEISDVVTMKRAAYAAFGGPIPEGMDVRAKCGARLCIAPDHAKLCPARRRARALALPGQVEALLKPETFVRPLGPSELPDGLTLSQINSVKFLTEHGNTLLQIATVAKLPYAEILRIRSGRYDGAVELMAKSRAPRRGFVGPSTAKSVADLSSNSLGSIAVPPPPVDVPALPDEISEEEGAWLRQIGKG